MDGQCQGHVLDVLAVCGDQRNGARDLKGEETIAQREVSCIAYVAYACSVKRRDARREGWARCGRWAEEP